MILLIDGEAIVCDDSVLAIFNLIRGYGTNARARGSKSGQVQFGVAHGMPFKTRQNEKIRRIRGPLSVADAAVLCATVSRI